MHQQQNTYEHVTRPLPASPETGRAGSTRHAFVNAMSKAVDTVTVVSTDGPSGRYGLTVSAFASVSADPALVSVCINRRSPLCDAIAENGVFAVNLLSSSQQQVSRVFAGMAPDGKSYDFGCADWDTDTSGSALLRDASANFDCAVEFCHEAGTHCIFIGRVLAARSNDRDTLIYNQRRYRCVVDSSAH